MLSSQRELDKALRLLGGILELHDGAPVKLVVCGGAALLARGLRERTTQDVDVLALLDDRDQAIAPVPLPEGLIQAASEVARTLDLPADWLNNEPSRDAHGLFQMGLPEGLLRRTVCRSYGRLLRIFFVDRVDLLYFKLYAAARVGGRHTEDLMALRPREEELEQAARWALACDRSADFHGALKGLIGGLGYGRLAEDL